MIPIVAGLLMGAAMGGGIAALQKKDILQGALMGGIGGALGGAFMPGVAGAAAGETVSAATAAAGNPGTFIAADQAASTAANAAIPAGEIGSIAHSAIPTTGANTGILGGSGGIGNFLSQNKGALMGGVAGGMMAPGQEPEKKSDGNVYDMSFSQERNPLFGQPGQSAFTNQGYKTNSITPVEDYTAANGGIIALAEGGEPGIETQRYERPVRQMAPEVAAYNAKLMERANQEYNVNLQPAPNQVPGSAGYIPPPSPTAAAASTADSISGLTFNPITQRFEGKYSAPGDEKKRSRYDMDEEEMPYYNHSSVSEGGAAGGMPGRDFGSYAGGGLSSLGNYSDGGQLLRGPGDGVSDDIPAQIGAKQPARLADGEFVVPARTVSELGNGSTDAGARQLYKMMDRVQSARKKSIGKGKVAVDSKAHRMLPA